MNDPLPPCTSTIQTGPAVYSIVPASPITPPSADEGEGIQAALRGESQKRWQTKAWRRGWQMARRHRRAHERLVWGSGTLTSAELEHANALRDRLRAQGASGAPFDAVALIQEGRR